MNITFQIKDKYYDFEPKDDITAMEAVRISELLFIAKHHATGKHTDEFIEQHNLMRHFDMREGLDK